MGAPLLAPTIFINLLFYLMI